MGPIEVVRERAWATVARVPLANGSAWLKACETLHAFEPRLTAELHARAPDLVAEVLAYEEERAWLLLADAGTPIDELGNAPEIWLRILPLYAELQRDEAVDAAAHVEHGVPDLRVGALAALYEDLLRLDLPLSTAELYRLRNHAGRFEQSCAELATAGIPESVQHDDLHMKNVYSLAGVLRILDWGDASISHPFASLVVTFRFLEERNGLSPDDPWFERLRDAYLEPWGHGLAPTFALAQRVGSFAHVFAWTKLRDHLPSDYRRRFDEPFAVVLRRALALAADEFAPQRRS